MARRTGARREGGCWRDTGAWRAGERAGRRIRTPRSRCAEADGRRRRLSGRTCSRWEDVGWRRNGGMALATPRRRLVAPTQGSLERASQSRQHSLAFFHLSPLSSPTFTSPFLQSNHTHHPHFLHRHWYYEDFVRPTAANPSLLPSYSLKAFSLLIFKSCPLLHDLLPSHGKIWTSFMAYKERVPVCGAVMINEWWDKVRRAFHFLPWSVPVNVEHGTDLRIRSPRRFCSSRAGAKGPHGHSREERSTSKSQKRCVLSARSAPFPPPSPPLRLTDPCP